MPSGIAADSVGRIYVADTGNHRVQMFDAAGRARSEAKGSGLGSSKKPSSIGLDSSGNGYVVDTENHRIQVSRCAITGRSGGGRVVGAGAAI